jgi:hypothetical protein
MEEMEANGNKEKHEDVTSVKAFETDEIEKPSFVYTDPPLTLKRFMVLFSLTFLWLSAAAPVFFIVASLCKSHEDQC